MNKKIGLLVPSGNTTVEPDFYKHIIDDNVTVHSMRIYGEKRTRVENYENIDNINSEIVKFSNVLNHANPDIIVYGFTTGSFYRGVEYAKELEEKIYNCTGKAAITASMAVLYAFHSMGTKKVSIVTPYLTWNNRVLRGFFNTLDYEIIGVHGDERSVEIAKSDRITDKGVDFAIDWILKSYDKECDTILLPCTAWKTYNCISKLEKMTNKKIVTSNQALLWYCANKLKFNVDVETSGKLFSYKL